MLSLVDDLQHNKPLVLNPSFVDGLKRILRDSSLDKVCLGTIFPTIHYVFFVRLVFLWGRLYHMSALIGFYAL